MIRFYNTLTKKIGPFKPLKKGQVLFYSCGPTVYDNPHIGNLRRYITDDVLHRYFLSQSLKVKRIINITDVGHLTQDDYDAGEDKIIVAAKREGKSPLAIARHYEKVFLDDAKSLNLAKPQKYTRASEHVSEMIKIIKKLVGKGVAYEVDGSVYFNVAKFKEYGRLSGNTLENLRQMVRPDLNEEAFQNKKSAEDFVLWVKARPKHLLKWPSPWSQGYPGWHIECAAMILKHLGKTIDIHTGGQDNIFPHHEDEIAEAKAATGKDLSNYWLHTGYLVVDNKKMSKSAGTTITLRDVVKKGFHPLALRYLVLSAHFSGRLNFTWPAMQAAQEGWLNLTSFKERLRLSMPLKTADKQDTTKELKTISKSFTTAIEDNLNTPKALSELAKLIKLGNRIIDQKGLTSKNKKALEKSLNDFDQILGLLPQVKADSTSPTKNLEVIDLIKQRDNYKNARQYSEADKLRDKILGLGYVLSDLPEGTRWTNKTTGDSGVVKNS